MDTTWIRACFVIQYITSLTQVIPDGQHFFNFLLRSASGSDVLLITASYLYRAGRPEGHPKAIAACRVLLRFSGDSPPTKELMKLTLEQRIAHGGHPVLRWMMDNIYIRTDPAGNIKADKEKSTEKIDGAVATIMGLDRAIRCGNQNTESVYDQRGILFL